MGAVGSIADTFAAYPGTGLVLPAMGYGQGQIADLQATIEAADCDVVVAGTPIDLHRVIHTRHPIRQVHYELRELGSPTLADVLAPLIERCRSRATASPALTAPAGRPNPPWRRSRACRRGAGEAYWE